MRSKMAPTGTISAVSNTMVNQSTHHLPRRPTPLVGREQEIAEILHRLDDPHCRLVTLAGPGGIGKTQLAIELTTRLDAFADGIYFVALQPVASMDLLVPAIANAIGVPLAGSDPLLTQLLSNLRHRQLLLVLDNFEHLLAAADLLVELLHAAPGIKLVVTSREVVGVREEWVYPVHGLAVPAPNARDDLASYSAIHLFSVRARQVRPEFRWEDEPEAVVSICRQVEGNPLAVELAASWLAVLTCAEIAVQIRQGLDILATTLRNVPERHRSMRVVFDHSWQLLSQPEHTVFGRLTVFQGGFTRHAAEVVAGASLWLLSALVAKSLLRRDPNGRYQIHELLHQYGAEKLATSPAEEAATHESHSAYFMAYLGERQFALEGSGQLQAVQEIAAELENVHKAWRWSVDHAHDQAHAAAICQTLRSLGDFYQMRSRYLEGLDVFADTVHRLESEEPAGVRGAALAASLTAYGWLCIRLGRLQEADAALLRSCRLYDQLGLPPPPERGAGPITALLFLALVQGDYDQASSLGERARRQAEEHHQPSALALVCYGLASAALAQGQSEQARAHAEQGLALLKALGDRWLRTFVHDLLGQVAYRQGEHQSAQYHFETAYAICTEFEAPGGMAVHLKHLGDVAAGRQNWAEAYALYRRALDFYQTVGDRGGMAEAQIGLGSMAHRIGDLNGAYRSLEQALETAMATRSLPLMLSVLAEASECLVQTAGTGRGKALGLRTLRFVCQYPSCDRKLYERTVAYLALYGGDAGDAQPVQGDTVESLAAALQAELGYLQSVVSARAGSPLLAAQAQSLIEPLTHREWDVLRLLAGGRSNLEIAGELVVTVGTVKTHTSNIYRKLAVANRAHAVLRARELCLLD